MAKIMWAVDQTQFKGGPPKYMLDKMDDKARGTMRKIARIKEMDKLV